MPTRFKYFVNNGAEFRGHYNREDGILTGLSSIPEYLRLEDLNFFDLVVFSFDNVKEFDVTCFDGRNVELVFHTYTIRSGISMTLTFFNVNCKFQIVPKERLSFN